MATQLLRLNILDRTTGVCIFERLWNWNATPNREGLCNLILTFYMLSRDIGEGDVSHVLFDATRGDKGKSQTGKQAHCRLSLGRSDTLIVALFHDPALDVLVVAQVMANILKQFESRYLADVRSLQPTLADMVNEKVDSAKKARPEDILSRFVGFEKEADTIKGDR